MHTLTQFKLCPQSRSIRLVLNELQIDFETREERPWEYRDELLAMNPSGELPVLSLSGGPILCGSYAISEYIAEEFKTANGAGRSVSLFPGSREDRAEVRRLVDWFHGKLARDVTRDMLEERVYRAYRAATASSAPDATILRAVRQNLRYFCALRGIARAEADRRISAELERFAMADRLDDKVRALNGGHRRRVELARALLHRPRILLLDEPTVGLDIPTRRDLIAHLHARSREDGIALLWATHLIDEVEAGNRVIVLHRGQIRADGPPASLVMQTGAADLAQAFNRLTGTEAAA